MSDLVLSLFPGIGLLDMAFEAEGFCVVRGPDKLWGGDVKRFHPPADTFGGVIGGPPCKCHSSLVHLCRAMGYTMAENLIPEFERVVSEAAPSWFLMENVPLAPLPSVPGYAVNAVLLNNRQCGGVQNRVRRFSFGTRDGLALTVATVQEPAEWAPAVIASSGGDWLKARNGSGGGGVIQKRRPLEENIRLQGLPADFLADAPFTDEGKREVVGNGVPLPLGRAIARAVREATAGAEGPSGPGAA